MEEEIPDEVLMIKDVKEFNRRIKHMPENVQVQARERRRTIKNCGYAKAKRRREEAELVRLERRVPQLRQELDEQLEKLKKAQDENLHMKDLYNRTPMIADPGHET